MPIEKEVRLGLGGIGDANAPASALGDTWKDADRALIETTGAISAWPGWNRTSEKLSKASLHGPAEDRLHILGFNREWIRQDNGHGVAVVDASANTRGRILALGHHASGRDSTKMLGAARQTTGSGLSDLTASGVYTGASPALVKVKISATGTPDSFQYSTDGGSSYNGTDIAITGGAQTSIGLGITIMFAATTGHTLNDVFTIACGGRPAYLGSMNRLSPHHYPSIAGAKTKLLIAHGYDTVKVHDGETIRDGLAGPQVKPVVEAAVMHSLADNGGDIAQTDAATIQWVAAKPGIQVDRRTVSPAPADGTAYVRVRVPNAYRHGGDLAYVNSTFTLPVASTRLKVYLQSVIPHSGHHKARPFSIVLCDAVALGGNRIECVLQPGIDVNRWVLCDIKIPTQTAPFSVKSIGIRLPRAHNTDPFTSNPGGLWPILIDKISISDSVVASPTLNADGNWHFCFCWFRTFDKRQSAPSPISDAMELNGAAMQIDLSGNYPGIPAGLANSPPDGVDAVMIYVSNDAWDVDPRISGDSFFRLSPDTGTPISELQSSTSVSAVSGTGTGDGNLEQLAATPGAPSATWTFTSKAVATDFTVSDGTTSYADAQVGVAYDNGLIHCTPRQTGTFVTGQTLIFTTTLETYSGGELIHEFSDQKSIDDLNSATLNARQPFFNGKPIPGELLIADGDIIISAIRPAYRIRGGFTWTDDSHILTPVAASDPSEQVTLGAWMEGRKVRRQGESTDYTIQKYIAPNGTYASGALFIGREFDPRKQELTLPYSGTTGNDPGIIAPDAQTIYWSNVTDEFGVDIEAFSVLNQLKIMPDGDEIVGGGKVDEFVYILGHANAFILRRSPQALADLPLASGAAYSNPTHLAGVGMLARRTWVQRRDGTAIFVGAKGELFIADKQGGIQKHPKSREFTAFVAGKGWLSDPALARHAFGMLKSDGERELYILDVISGFDTETAVLDDNGRNITWEPGVTIKSRESFAFES